MSHVPHSLAADFPELAVKISALERFAFTLNQNSNQFRSNSDP